jgi:thioredoxin-like negative regulator of GroEL
VRAAWEAGLSVRKIDISQAEGRTIAAQLRIFRVPAAVLVDDAGHPMRSWGGLPTIEDLREAAGGA